MRNMKSRKAVSPVIATVILVAVAITVSVAVSYWMGGISSQYTQFEKVEIQTGYSVKTLGSGWTLYLELKNSGSAAATIGSVFINEGPLNATAYDANNTLATAFAAAEIQVNMDAPGLHLESGQTGIIEIYVPESLVGSYFSSGTTLDCKLHSANGNDYIKLIKLV